MKLIVAGSRDFTDYDAMERELDKFLSGHRRKDVTIISGCARGADMMAQTYALERGINLVKVPADWKSLGKVAGYVRNEEMADMADTLVAFWDGASRGTESMIKLANKYGLMVRIVRF